MPRKKVNKKPNLPKPLRERAEQTMRTMPTDITNMAQKDVRRLVHELQIHQIELELQNIELRNAQVELADSRDRYFDLYDFAPVGYVTLDQDGKILESNLTAATMLGVDRRSLLRSNISKFVTADSQDEWFLHRQAVFSIATKQVCEIRMRNAAGRRLTMHLESIGFGLKPDRRCRTALIDITDRKSAEVALHELNVTLEQRVQNQTSQIRLQAEAIAHLGEGVLITQGPNWAESRITFVNDAACRITGYAAEELIDRKRSCLHGIETDGQTVKRIQAELSSGNSCQAELVHYRKDGTPYAAEVSITPLRSVARGSTTFVSIQRDITERKKAEQTLRESEQRFRHMANNAPVLMWISGRNKACTWFNKPWLDFTGRTIEQEIGNGWADGVHPEDLARCMETYVTSFDARYPFTMEYRLRRHDGQWRWVVDNGVPLHQENGDFTGYIGSCIDITGSRHAEEELRASEDRMRTILNTAADAIITTDRGGTIVVANPATEQMFGYTENELVGQSVQMLMPSPYPAGDDSYIDRYLKTGEARSSGASCETIGVRKDGSTFPVELAVSEIARLGLFTGIHRDVSARKQTELELDQYRKDLRTMSSELMLAEERERQRLAQDLHDGLGQALFRARLRIDQSPSRDDAAFKEIGTILEDIGRMVNTLTFQLSPPVLRQLGLRSAIRWLVQDMRRQYGLSITFNDDGQPLPIEERVSLVVFRSVREVLINIAKHAQTNSATISLHGSERSLQTTIEDYGKGFNLADQSRHVEDGHFGLFSIRERVEYLGGSFEIQSTPGEGTRVTMTVPLSPSAAKAKST